MALNKQPLNINFAQGLDTKTDPFQVQPGKFLTLENSVFDKAGRLTKRNGFAALTALPDDTSTYLTTFNNALTAIGNKIEVYSSSNKAWVNKGPILPVNLNTLPLIRSNNNQSAMDSAIAPNGFVCTAFVDNVNGVAITKYVVADSATGQNITAPVQIPVSSGTPTGYARVFVLGTYFVIVFTNLLSGIYQLKYLALSITNPSTINPAANIASAYSYNSSGPNFDGIVANNQLYVAYNSITGGQSIKVTSLTTGLVLQAPVTLSGEQAQILSVFVDTTASSQPIVWVAYNNSSSQIKAFALSSTLVQTLAPTTLATGVVASNITSISTNQILTVYFEVANNYGYDSAIPTHYITSASITSAGSVTTGSIIARSVGLASKAFVINSTTYFLTAYQSDYQPTYFLMNAAGTVISKLAYSNGGGYVKPGLPSVSVLNSIASVPYLIKDQISSQNKTQGNSAPAIYAQTGINLASFDFTTSDFAISATELGNNLNLSGGFISGYDGYSIVEQNFFVWPDNVEVTTTTGSGSLIAQQYYYQVVYEWSDNQGNIFRSAPSIPVSVTTTTGSSTNTIYVPTLRLTYKTANPVKITVYRWSTAQQEYYAIKSPSSTTQVLNDTSVDYVTITDAASDASIIGNPLIYTTGGVLENIAPPASNIMTLFNNRLWLVDSEDQNLLWFSKQVIEATPVEMSDLLTMYIAPTTASQGSTGPITALSPMDDKLIIFKANALGYISGIGPDNTGSNGTYSDYILINSVVGCTDQRSIVFTPAGLMFQSNKGIWLLGRDLSTQYIGAPVEALTTGVTVQSALNIPTTNQVRFTLSSGITLMYDYYFQQWGTFTNVPAITSTIYQSLQTYVDKFGQVFQETPGVYLDNTAPVLMSFTTNWMNLAGLQGYERFYFMYLLGQYLTPFKLNVQVGYDYNTSPTQQTIVSPVYPGPNWGGNNLWGDAGTWGGNSNVFEARVFPQKQKCESFQVIVTELYDSSIDMPAGAGLTLSGLNLIVGMKKGYRTNAGSRNFG